MSNNDLFRENAEQTEEYAYVIVSSFAKRDETAVENELERRTNALAKRGFRVLGMTQYRSLTTVVMGRIRPETKEEDNDDD